MEAKKQPMKYLNGMRGIYFVIVLVVLLVLIYTALEWKTPSDDGGYDIDAPIEDVQKPSDSAIIIRTTTIMGDTVSNQPIQ